MSPVGALKMDFIIETDMKKLFFTAVAALATLTLSAQTQVIAHRGFHAQEGSARNTISSLLNAQKLGVYGSECDISMSADDSLMVVHGSRHPDRRIPAPHRVHVAKDVYKDIRAISCEGGNIVPTLREYLVQTKKYPGTKLVIEIKNHKEDTPERQKFFTKKIVEMVAEFGLENQVDYIAFSKVVCDELVKLAPKNEIAYLNGELTPAECKQRGYTGIDYSIKVLRAHPEWVKQAHDLGMKVNVWTVNKTEDIQYFIDLGVDFITTDNPLETIELINKSQKGNKCKRAKKARK